MSVIGIILALVGAFVLGLASLSFGGVLSGLFIGYLFGWVGDVARHNRELRQRLAQLEERLKGEEREAASDSRPAEAGAVSVPVTETKPEMEPQAGAKPVPPAIALPRETPAMEPTAPARPRPQSIQPGRVHPPSPAEEMFSKLFAFIRGFFTDGNVVVRVGLLVLFVGVGFLLRYAVQHDMLSIEARLLGAAVGGLVLLVLGWRQRHRRQTFALLLQGGGVGIMYITVFGAAKLFGMVPLGMAFALMVALVILSTALALLQDAKSLALFGAAGGFLTPILLSTGSNDYVALFGFYALLNLGILSVAWYRSWRELNLLGFLFTFGIGSFWGVTRYEPAFFATTEPFLILFFLMYVAIAVLFAFRQPEGFRGYVDGTLVFGTPIVTAALQGGMVYRYEYGMALSALALAFFYIVLARALWARGSEATRRVMRLLTESFLAMAVVFGTLAIPLALDGRWSSAAWAMEGAALVWLGVRQARWLARNFGLLLQLAAGVFYAHGHDFGFDALPVWNGVFLGGILISLAALFSGWYLYRRRDELHAFEGFYHVVMFLWGVLWWFGTTLNEVIDQVPTRYEALAALAVIGASFALMTRLAPPLRWPLLRYPMLFQVGLLYLFTLIMVFGRSSFHFLAGWDAVFWLPVFALTAWMLRYAERFHFSRGTLAAQHLAAFIYVAIAVAIELSWLLDDVVHAGKVWSVSVWGLVPLLFLYLPARAALARRWPVRDHDWAWRRAGGVAMVLWAWGWALLTMLQLSGATRFLPYIPVLNPLELSQLAVMVGIVLWFLREKNWLRRHLAEMPQLLVIFMGGTAFLWLNTVVARGVYHFSDGVYWSLASLARSTAFQSGIAILWGVTALVLLILAGRLANRAMRIVALSLVGLTLAKLFFIDLANREELEVIMTFLVVGAVYVAAGYFSHLPADKEKEA